MMTTVYGDHHIWVDMYKKKWSVSYGSNNAILQVAECKLRTCPRFCGQGM